MCYSFKRIWIVELYFILPYKPINLLRLFLLYLFLITLFIYWIFWPHDMWDLSSPIRDWTWAPAVEMGSLNHWTNREFPIEALLHMSLRKMISFSSWFCTSSLENKITTTNTQRIYTTTNTQRHISWVWLENVFVSYSGLFLLLQFLSLTLFFIFAFISHFIICYIPKRYVYIKIMLTYYFYLC